MTKVPNPFPIIPFRPKDEPTICIPVNVHWLPALRGMVQRHRYPEFWQGTLEENRQARADVLELLDILDEAEKCDDMNDCNCVVTVVVLHRIDPISLQLQISVDNGQTWTPDPQSPLNQGVQQPGLIESGNGDKCLAANYGTSNIAQIIVACSEQLGLAATVFDLAIAVCSVALGVFIFLVIGPETAPATVPMVVQAAGLIWGIARAAFALGKTAFDDYWDETETHKITKAIYCTIGDDGKFTPAQYNRFLAKWRQLATPSIAFNFVMSANQIGGNVGLTNMCSYGIDLSISCDDFDCEECFDGWAAHLATATDPTEGEDEIGKYWQWTAVVTTIPDYRVQVSNDGNWPSANYNDNCCVPGDSRFRTMKVGTEEEKTIQGIFGFKCGDNDLNHFGASNNLSWWGFEAKNSNDGGAFDIRLYKG